MLTKEEVKEFTERFVLMVKEVCALLDKPPLLEPEYYKALEELHNN